LLRRVKFISAQESLMIRKAKAMWHGTGRAGNG